MRKTLEDLADVPEIKLRLRVDPSTKQLVQQTQQAVDAIIQPILDRTANIPSLQVRPISDTTLGSRSVTNSAEDMAALFTDECHRSGADRFDVLPIACQHSARSR